MSPGEFGQASEVALEQTVQTCDANWLCLYEIYPKFHIPNLYRIGSTGTPEELHYCFTFRTEKVGDIFLLHLYISNHREGPFRVVVSTSNVFICCKETDIAVIEKTPIDFFFKGHPILSHNYIHTYSFSDIDVECLKKKNLFIAVSFNFGYNGNQLNLDLLNDIKLNHDYSALLFDPIGSDLIVEAADGTKFQLHKNIMIANSEILKKNLMSKDIQKENNCYELRQNNYFEFGAKYNYYKFGYKHYYFKHAVSRCDAVGPLNMSRLNYYFVQNHDYSKFDGVNANVLCCMVEFIYTGTVKAIDNVNFVEVLNLAHKYELHNLSLFCRYVLSEQINLKNAINILVAAHTYDDDSLKLTALKYIAKNKNALKSSTFQEIDDVELLTELCNFLVL